MAYGKHDISNLLHLAMIFTWILMNNPACYQVFYSYNACAIQVVAI